MKILVVSLLRLGDLIQQIPLIEGLRVKYPTSEIHVLLNQQFTSAQRILASKVDKFILFDRDLLQKGLGEAEFNILWSYTQLEVQVAQLSSASYDHIFNFTHTRLSAYLIGAIEAKEKHGLYQQDGKFKGLDNRWIKYFNDRFSGTQKSVFHYVELLGNSFDIPLEFVDISMSKNNKKNSKLVLIQCLTSDEKKNWGLKNFKHLKQTLNDCLGDYSIKILGAPFEKERLSFVFGDKDLLICDLQEVQQHLKEAELLITGDTSIKHIAAQIGTPIIEIAIGSSDPQKTGAYSKNKTILQTMVPCAPCSHSQACFQKSHICAEEITVDAVFAAVWSHLSGDSKRKTIEVAEFEKMVWSLYLNHGQSLDPKYDIDIEIVEAARSFRTSKGDLSVLMNLVRQQSAQFALWIARAERSLPQREALLEKTALHSSEVAELIMVGQDIIRSKLDEYGYFDAFIEAMTARISHPIQLHDSVTVALKNVKEILEIREKVTTYVELPFELVSKEGAFYAPGIGRLSINGFEENRTGKPRHEQVEGRVSEPASYL